MTADKLKVIVAYAIQWPSSKCLFLVDSPQRIQHAIQEMASVIKVQDELMIAHQTPQTIVLENGSSINFATAAQKETLRGFQFNVGYNNTRLTSREFLEYVDAEVR